MVLLPYLKKQQHLLSSAMHYVYFDLAENIRKKRDKSLLFKTINTNM